LILDSITESGRFNAAIPACCTALNTPESTLLLTAAFENFNPLKDLNLPSSPSQPVVVKTEPDRPQPKHDLMINNGMSSVVGRIRTCSVLDYKFVVLGHNTIRGAAGAAILNAELMKAKGYLR